jgi:hypothetical protein
MPQMAPLDRERPGRTALTLTYTFQLFAFRRRSQLWNGGLVASDKDTTR